jgi:hypothetical protein
MVMLVQVIGTCCLVQVDWYRLIVVVVYLVIVTGCLHLALICQGGWMGQGQVVEATFRLYPKNIGGFSLLLVVARELGSWSFPQVVA